MLPDQNIRINVTKGSIGSVRKMGYPNVEIGDSIDVSVQQLMPSSNRHVQVICDYCGTEYSVMMSDLTKTRRKQEVIKDACSSCRKRKSSEVLQVRYGVSLPLDAPGAYDKMIQTIETKYGGDKLSCFPTDRIEQLDDSQGCLPGVIKTSKPQGEMYQALKDYGYEVCLNYPTSWGYLDVALFYKNYLIDVEYDGRYWHPLDSERDRIRNERAINDGWYVIRFRGNTAIPTIEQLNTAIKIAITENRPLQVFELAG